MASRANPYYDPRLAQAFSNLAGMFAPPSGSDAAGFAAANAKRAEAERQAEVFRRMVDPTADNTVRDRFGIAGGLFNPQQSFYSVDTNATTLRRGQDVEAGTKLRQTEMQQRGETDRTMLAPVGQGATRFVPPSIAQLYGVPGQQIGVVETKPGERSFLPDGRVLDGPAPALTMDQIKGRVMQGLPENEQRAITFGSTPVEQVIAGGQPTIVARRDAIGQTPAPAQGGARKDGTALINGRQVPVTRDPTGMQWQMADGTPIPPNVQVFDMAKPQGTNEQLGITTANTSDANKRAAEVTRTINLLDAYEKLVDKNPGALGLVGLIRGTAQNAAATVNDVAAAFGKDAPQINEIAAEMRSGLSKVAPEFFNPAIPEADFLQGALAYGLARTENPSGEVSRQAYERALERIRGGGLLANTQSTKSQINAMRNVLNGELQAIGVLRNPATATRATGAQPLGGQGSAVASQAQQGQGPVRVTTPEEAMALPSGTPFVTPDGRVKVRP